MGTPDRMLVNPPFSAFSRGFRQGFTSISPRSRISESSASPPRWEGSIWIVMEMCDFDLDKYFREKISDITIEAKVDIMKQAITGLAYLHSKNVVHRDIKPGNILVECNESGVTIKLADFGMCKKGSSMSSTVGTIAFLAPEFFQSNTELKYHRDVDVYAAGLTFMAMLQAHRGTFVH